MRARLAKLRDLNPLSLVFGPVFQKDVRVAGRRKGTYWLRSIYTLLLLIIITFAFITFNQNTLYENAAARLQLLQTLAPTIAIATLWSQFVLLALISPVLTAGAISDEKRARTMSSLMTTPLTSAQIILSKLASSLVQLTILTLISTPILLAVRIFGGLDTQIVLAATLIIISTAILGAALGLLYSCWHKRATNAVVLAIISNILVQAMPITVVAILLARDMLPIDDMPHIVLVSCPPAILLQASLSLVGEDILSQMGTQIVPWQWTLWLQALATALYLLSIATLVSFGAVLALRKVMLQEAAGQIKLTRKERRRLAQTPAAPAAPQPTPDKLGQIKAATSPTPAPPERDHASLRVVDRSRVVSDLPVLWRELRQNAFSGKPVLIRVAGVKLLLIALTAALLIASFRVSDRSILDLPRLLGSPHDSGAGLAHLVNLAFAALAVIFAVARFRKGVTLRTTNSLLIIAAVVAAFFFYLYIVVGFDNTGLGPFIGVTSLVAALIIASVMTTSGISGEREARTWDVLLTTTLTPREIILGKFIGALKKLLILPALLLIHLLLSAIFGATHPIAIPLAMLVFLGPILFLASSGVLFSLLFKKATTAAVCNMGLALTMWVGSWVGLYGVMIALDFPDDGVAWGLLNVNIALSPPTMMYAVTETNAYDIAYHFNSSRYATYDIFSDTVGRVGFSAIVTGAFLFYCTLAAGAIAIATSIFDARSGRSS